MNGEGFAFAAWIRLMTIRDNWTPNAHDWNCEYCRAKWTDMQRATARTIPE